MFQNDPDEDAAFLDDDALVAAYLRPYTTQDTGAEAMRRLPDWPPLTRREPGITIDPDVLAWFKRHHADWRREIRLVLKGWVAAQCRPGPESPAVSRRLPAPGKPHSH
ncbi:hypothetical protein [Rhodopila sp.]|jgi:hypothetical protein|uniref:hypothetical protein n=1 Tax=Rhodopila sp. TaxID=2480087 RepID=UPI002C269134|nr:hypothetical protein [Rhodopila sp.]HVZ09392.1 hypothetical protein [Rhodopila sp.]